MVAIPIMNIKVLYPQEVLSMLHEVFYIGEDFQILWNNEKETTVIELNKMGSLLSRDHVCNIVDGHITNNFVPDVHLVYFFEELANLGYLERQIYSIIHPTKVKELEKFHYWLPLKDESSIY